MPLGVRRRNGVSADCGFPPVNAELACKNGYARLSSSAIRNASAPSTLAMKYRCTDNHLG